MMNILKLINVVAVSVMLSGLSYAASESADAWKYARKAWPKDKSMHKYYAKKTIDKLPVWGNLKNKYRLKMQAENKEKEYRLIIKICDHEYKGQLDHKVILFETLAKRVLSGSIGKRYLQERLGNL